MNKSIGMSDDKLKQIIQDSENIVWKDSLKGSWESNLSNHLINFQKKEIDDIASKEKLTLLFESEAVCATGQAKSTPIKNALNSDVFRMWFAKKVCDSKLEKQATDDDFINLYKECLSEIKPYCINKNGKAKNPTLKMSRALCALYPTKFSVICSEKSLKKLHQQITGNRSKNLVEMHRAIFDRLDHLLGPININDTREFAKRMILPMQIYARLNPDTIEGRSSNVGLLPAFSLETLNNFESHLPTINTTKELATNENQLPQVIKYTDQFDVDEDSEEPASSKIIQTKRFDRDRNVRLFVLARAKGYCEFCGERGFLTKEGKIYLETHHIVPLSETGDDRAMNIIALCANDHRKAHSSIEKGTLREQFKKIISEKLT